MKVFLHAVSTYFQQAVEHKEAENKMSFINIH